MPHTATLERHGEGQLFAIPAETSPGGGGSLAWDTSRLLRGRKQDLGLNTASPLMVQGAEAPTFVLPRQPGA